MTAAQGQAASESRRELGLGAIGAVVCLLIGEHFPDLNHALEQAGYRIALHASFASALEEPSAAGDVAVAFVDTSLLHTDASFDVATVLAAAVPLALLTRSGPVQDLPGLSAIPAVAALPFPPDPAVLIASLPYWRARHQEFKALKEVEHGLQLALVDSRFIGNAVGMMAERHGISMSDAFDMIRGKARATRQRVEQVAQDIIDVATRAAAARRVGRDPESTGRPERT